MRKNFGNLQHAYRFSKTATYTVIVFKVYDDLS